MIVYTGRKGLHIFDIDRERWIFNSKKKGYMYEDIYHDVRGVESGSEDNEDEEEDEPEGELNEVNFNIDDENAEIGNNQNNQNQLTRQNIDQMVERFNKLCTDLENDESNKE